MEKKTNNKKTTDVKSEKKTNKKKTTDVKQKKKVNNKKTIDVKMEKKIDNKISVDVEKEEKTNNKMPMDENLEKKIDNKMPIDVKLDKLTIISLCIIVVGFAFLIFKIYSNNINYSKSYLSVNNVGKIVTCDNLKENINKDSKYLFITKTGTKEEYKLEKKIASMVKNYKLNDSFLVYLKDDNCNLNNELGISKEEINKLPIILYYKDGKLIDKAIREDELMLEDGDFMHLLDIYEDKNA